MILTGKARKEFTEWYNTAHGCTSIDLLEIKSSDVFFKSMRNTLIVHWFGTVGLEIQYIREYNMIEAAIIEANHIYNSNVKK